LETNNILSNLETYPKIPTSIYGNNYPEGYESAMQTISVEDIVKTIQDNL
jgi:hypothetical protein